MSSRIPHGSPRSGAARVGVTWLIVVLVVALAALALFFTAQSDLKKSQEELAKAQSTAKESKDKESKEAEAAGGVSKLLGWYDRTSQSPRSNLPAAQTAFNELKTALADLGNGATDLETALPLIQQAIKARNDEIQQLKDSLEGVKSELSAKNGALAQITDEKNKQISELNQRLSDESANATQLQNELQARLDKAVGETQANDSEKRKLQAEIEQLAREHSRKLQDYEARFSQLKQLTAFAEPPLANQPDARVLAVSDKLDVAWIDIGSNQRLVPGMRFRLEAGGPGAKHKKAMGEVVAVEATQATLRVSDLADPYDPVVEGDVAVNPVYDPAGERFAMLVGRFTGTYNEKDVRTLLARMNIKVQDKIDVNTNYLIVGAEIWTDENGQPLETPIQPSEMPVYREAESLGVQIVPLNDFRTYFKM